jgi:hypothetical protein
MRRVADLRLHALNKALYGPPTANGAYKDIRADMARRGFNELKFLLVTEDGRILWGTTRWAAAKSLGLEEVPCRLFTPSDPATAELEMEAEVVRDNAQRIRTEVIRAREQRALLEVERRRARERMGGGSDGGPSKSADRVGKIFGESGKTVARRLKVLEAIEAAEAEGDRRRADRLTELLNAKKVVKALEVAAGKPAPPRKPPAADAPRTLHDHASKAYSEFFEACAKVRVAAEVEQLGAVLGRMRDDLETARGKAG